MDSSALLRYPLFHQPDSPPADFIEEVLVMKFRPAALALLFALSCGITRAEEALFPGSEKVTPWVLDHISAGQTAEFLVVLRRQADLRGADALNTKAEKGAFVRDALWGVAQATQGPILDLLTSRGVPHRAYYIVNLILVKGDRNLVAELAARDDVARIEGNPVVHNDLPRPEAIHVLPDTIEPGISYVNAPQVWALGFTGQGVVVADQDTGQQWDHPALKNHYRGWDGSSASHDYNWHDSIHNSIGNPCGNDSPFPCDDYGHGTHTMGTVVGDDGAGNQIGMAPGAKWISCRNMDQGNGTPARYIECFEFQLAPYPVGGDPSQGDPTKAPDLTTNSWGCPSSEGCSANTLLDAVNAQSAAGILTVVAAGNSGSSCSTVSDPPSFYEPSFTAGAIDAATGQIASFSSRGPVTADGSGRMKPEITAPGVSVRSSVPTNSYAYFSGTSMATPHVAGAVALLWSAVPSLANQIPVTEFILEQNANHVSYTACSSSGYPNNTYGWGRLDILSAVTAASCASPPTASASGTATICQGMSTPLSGSGGANCFWSPPTGLDHANSCTPTASPTATTVYTLTVTDAGGCPSTNNSQVTVTVPPPPVVTPSGPTTFCQGGSVTLDAGTGYTSYLWSPGGQTTQTITVSSSGSYSVTTTDASGCVGTSAGVSVTVLSSPNPSISANGPTTFCTGGSVVLDAGAGYSAYLWSPGGETTRTITATASGSYSVTVTSLTGCPGTSAPVEVTVLSYPAPAISVSSCLAPNTSGLTASVPANAGDTYTWTITGGTIDSGQGTDTISFTSGPAASLMTLSIDESNGICSGSASEAMQVDFNDVPASNPFHNFICTIARNGITTGCGGGDFCPAASVLRSQMAVFLLRGEHGSTYTPPPCAGIFGDVTCPSPFADWIEQLYGEGITGGCSMNPLSYCPSSAVTRAGMAVFLLVAEHGSGYAPPACVGVFADVACPSPFADWIEQLYAEGITGGCGSNPLTYCPGNAVTRGQMAVFLTAAFNLP
jgi:serine protease AprX